MDKGIGADLLARIDLGSEKTINNIEQNLNPPISIASDAY
jgi:hypothetical protein